MSKSVISACPSETSSEASGPRSSPIYRALSAPASLYNRELIISPIPGHLPSKSLSHLVEGIKVAAINYEPLPARNIYHPTFSFSSTANMSSHQSFPGISSTPSTSISSALVPAPAPQLQIQLSPTTCSLTSVRILVRTPQGLMQEYTLHRELLCFHSPYFSDLLSRNAPQKSVRRKMVRVPRPAWQREDWWVRDEEGDVRCHSHSGSGKEESTEMEFVIKLPSAEIPAYELPFPITVCAHETFGAFVDWLYNGRKSFMALRSADSLVHLWLFAARVGVPLCQNEVVEQLVEIRRSTGGFPVQLLPYVERETREWEDRDRGLTRLFFDAVVWSGEREGGVVNVDGAWEREVWIALVQRMREWLVFGGVLMWGHQCPLDMLESRSRHYWVRPVVHNVDVDVNTDARRESQELRDAELLLGIGGLV